ncbi:putative adhesin [Marinibactrum halimedae]|uniref:Putative adhesin Stv domain-containing protein n=1 Tax=Marinibactrum halimedae TaxID=1444977 RepID=A0AA37T2R7_9GAMM|nr:hypothetical protein [Marinibactrum halimedae]MCD9461317.1 hypothetical protein [Marinibactrum halimedae]GLS25134.1 hypothetical protein GCM10007877_08480 [Marinibactrum halimedae]
MSNFFKCKSQILTGNYNCVDIAGKMYLWTPKNLGGLGQPKRLIISAHGGRRTNFTFRITQNTTLNFYSNDGRSVTDPGIWKFYQQKHRATPQDTYTQGDRCYNYILSKYTNSRGKKNHNKGSESYDIIESLMKKDFQKDAQEVSNALVTMMGSKNTPEATKAILIRDNLKRLQDLNAMSAACVLTIRNRRSPFMASVNLKWVLDELESRGYDFNQVDCIFCRNSLWKIRPKGPQAVVYS